MAMTSNNAARRPRLVIVGCGFGGLSAVQKLRRADLEITIVDRSNHHLFQPLLYQVATAALNPSDIAYPIRRIVRGRENIRVVLEEVRGIDVEARTIRTDTGDLGYDYLILAAGAVDTYHGHPEWSEFAPGLKSIRDALEIRRRFLIAFEFAEREPDEAKRRAWLTFVIAGGGPTGVEMAGTMADVARYTLSKDFRRIDPRTARFILIEGDDVVLPAYVKSLSESARKQLEAHGVEVRTGVRVEAMDEGGRDGRRRTDRGTNGGLGSRRPRQSLGGVARRAARQVRTGHRRAGPDDSRSSRSLRRRRPGESRARRWKAGPPASPRPRCSKVSMPPHPSRTGFVADPPASRFATRTRGRSPRSAGGAAVADLGGRWKFSGTIAWMLWSLIHIFFLVGFRNRLLVMVQWAGSYLSYNRGARLITGRVDPPEDQSTSTESTGQDGRVASRARPESVRSPS